MLRQSSNVHHIGVLVALQYSCIWCS